MINAADPAVTPLVPLCNEGCCARQPQLATVIVSQPRSIQLLHLIVFTFTGRHFTFNESAPLGTSVLPPVVFTQSDFVTPLSLPIAAYPAAYGLVGQPFPQQPTLVAQQHQQPQQQQQREGDGTSCLSVWGNRPLFILKLFFTRFPPPKVTHYNPSNVCVCVCVRSRGV